jgi:hypothetical protein
VTNTLAYFFHSDSDKGKKKVFEQKHPDLQKLSTAKVTTKLIFFVANALDKWVSTSSYPQALDSAETL